MCHFYGCYCSIFSFVSVFASSSVPRLLYIVRGKDSKYYGQIIFHCDVLYSVGHTFSNKVEVLRLALYNAAQTNDCIHYSALRHKLSRQWQLKATWNTLLDNTRFIRSIFLKRRNSGLAHCICDLCIPFTNYYTKAHALCRRHILYLTGNVGLARQVAYFAFAMDLALSRYFSTSRPSLVSG